MRTVAVLTTVLSLAACSNKSDNKAAPPPTEKPAAAAETAPAAPTAAPAASASKLTCDKVFPQSLRDKYFANAKVEEFPVPIDISATCIIKGLAEGDLKLETTCHENVVLAKDASIKAMKKSLPIKEVPGVGNPALAYTMPDDTTYLTAYDDNSNCQVMGTIPKSIDAAAFINDWLAVLPAT